MAQLIEVVVLVILGGMPNIGQLAQGLLCPVTGALNLYMVTLDVRTHGPTALNSGAKLNVALLAVVAPVLVKRPYRPGRNSRLLPISTET